MTEKKPENAPDDDLPEAQTRLDAQTPVPAHDEDDAPVAPLALTAAEYAAIYDGDDESETPDDADDDDAPAADPAAQKGERIAKAMARAGVASRRDAERMILEGRVTVNGDKIASPALDIRPGDKVRIDGKPMDDPQETRLWLYYKPVGLVTSESDEKGRQTVFDALPRDLPRVMSVGRLDLNSEGLLLLTNDGALKRRLELPATGWLRRYRVRVNGTPSDLTFAPLRRGAEIDGEEFQPMEIKLDSQQGANAWLTVGLREGKNREIRRAMAHVGLIVNRLIRIGYGPFKLIGMEPNEVREVKRKVLRDQLGGLLTGDPDDKPRVFRARGTDDARGPRRDDRGERGGDRGGDRGPRPARDGDRPDRKPRTPRDGGDRRAAHDGGRPPRQGGYADRAEGDRKPSAPRDGGGFDRKPRFARDGDADRKPRFAREGDGDRKPRFTKDGDGDRKPRAPRPEGGFDRKPRSGFGDGDRPRGPRSDGPRSDGPRSGPGSDSRPAKRFDRAEGGERPARAGGNGPGPRGPRPAYQDRPQADRDGGPARKPRFEGGRDGDRPAKPAYRRAAEDRGDTAARAPRQGAGGSGAGGSGGARFGAKRPDAAEKDRAPRSGFGAGAGKGPGGSAPRSGGPGGASRGGPGGKPPRGSGGPAGKGFAGKGPRAAGPGGRAPGGKPPSGKGPGGKGPGAGPRGGAPRR